MYYYIKLFLSIEMYDYIKLFWSYSIDSFYNKLGIIPNYTPLLSNSILNLSLKNKNIGCKGDLILKSFKSHKFNFYSTFKNLLPIKNYRPHLSPCSEALLAAKLFDCRALGHENKLDNHLILKYQSTLKKYETLSSKTFPFRLESRCKLEDIDFVVEKLNSMIGSGSFSFYRSDRFINILDQNLKYLSEIIVENPNVFTPDSLIKSIITEHISNEIFINGSSSCSILPYNINKYLKTSLQKFENSVGLININLAIKSSINLLSNNEKKLLLTKLLKFSKNINENSKKLFEILFESFYSINIDDPAKLLFNAFVQEQSKNNLLSYECLKEKNEYNSTITFSEWVKKYFLKIKKYGMSFFPRLIFEMLVYKTNCTRDALVE